MTKHNIFEFILFLYTKYITKVWESMTIKKKTTIWQKGMWIIPTPCFLMEKWHQTQTKACLV